MERNGGPGVVWFRADLRLDDNPAWAAATSKHRDVVALFVVDDLLLNRAGSLRRDQLLAHVGALDARLREMGAALVVREGPAADAVASVVRECAAGAVYVNAHASPYAVRRDAAVRTAVGVPFVMSHGATYHEPGSILTGAGTLARVFSAFERTWSSTPPPSWPQPGPCRPIPLPGTKLPQPQGEVRQTGGERAAWERLTAWLERVDDYLDTRDRLDIEGTSELSADLKFGTIAARTVVDAVGTGTPGRDAFVRQLAWRDWWAHQLAERQDMASAPLVVKYDRIVWRAAPDEFRRWCDGRTGFPVVDAGMRQLRATGWLPNRARMICASFLVKDLLIDWRDGERYFRHHLVDGDVAQNAGNWQWVAGTGPDAAPYFRIFNPTAQAEKYDPDGAYVRRWVPELAGLAGSSIHTPWDAGPLELISAGVELGLTYPLPIVDHATARTRALTAYAVTRD